MKLAVIDHIANPGGGVRVVRSLLAAMRRVRPDVEITFFGNPHEVKGSDFQKVSQEHSIELRALSSTYLSGKDLFKLRGSRHLMTLAQRKWEKPLSLLPFTLSGRIDQELKKRIKGFDAALFTWPFHLKCPELDCPMAGIFHDFNFHYLFGASFSLSWIQKFLFAQTPLLLEKMIPIVTTDYMKTEVAKFYPQFAPKVRVIPIAPMNSPAPISRSEIQNVLKKFQLPDRFILAPTNGTIHKNLGTLMAAVALLWKKGVEVPLVIVGVRTECYNGKGCEEGMEIGMAPQNIFGLGYVSHAEIDALIQAAAVVVNPSLYEGNNGPGFDAWSQGTPVAMSRIPPFVEHMERHGVKAALFDPRSPVDIAEKLAVILENPVQASEDAKLSQEAIHRFSWEGSALQYLEILEEAIEQKRAGNRPIAIDT